MLEQGASSAGPSEAATSGGTISSQQSVVSNGQTLPAADRVLPASIGATRALDRFIPLAGGLGGLALAFAGEMLVENQNGTQLSLALYLAGIVLFTVTTWKVLRTKVDMAVDDPALDLPKAADRRRVWTILGGGTGLAIAMNVVALLLIRDQLDSPVGLYLWLGSLLVIGATGVMVRRMEGWAPRWGTGVWPTDRRYQALLLVAILAIMVVAILARLTNLDTLPYGINADEGDRGAVAIQVVRGYNTDSIFSNGWYWISMLYFWLLAQVMKVVGIGFAQARVLGGLAGVVSVGLVIWIGIRNFGVRVGLLAGALLSLLAVSIQFARETSEAGLTATLWTLSVAFFMEGARRGRSWAWIAAGMAGGFALYFYPSGRLWALVALGFCVYLLVHGLGGGRERRLGILRGSALAAIVSVMVVGPFLIHSLAVPEVLTLRARETSIFTGDNPARLHYYKPEWSLPELLAAQVDRSVGVFNQYHEDGGFWPTDKPIMYGTLAVLTLLGMGWTSLRLREPRFVLLALWFWVGLLGVIVTVETPNLQRMATAVPVLALFPALVLDSMARRIEVAFTALGAGARRAVVWATSAAAAVVILVLMRGEWEAYFVTYAATDRWPQPTVLGNVINDMGSDTLAVTVGRQYHQINSGWVRLMAPNTGRGGVMSPGMSLPLTVPQGTNLEFLVFPKQEQYLPYLQSLYPGGQVNAVTHPTEGLMFTTYRVPKEQMAQMEGATAQVAGADPVNVDTLGAPPPGVSLNYPAQVRWRAGLRAPRYWNYTFSIGPGPAKLTIDGVKVLEIGPDSKAENVTVSLVRGLHAIDYEGTLSAANKPALFMWGAEPQQDDNGKSPAPDLQTPLKDDLYRNVTTTTGLLGVVKMTAPDPDGKTPPGQKRLDGTLATCCLSENMMSGGRDYTADWTGTLQAPVSGAYSMTLLAQGVTDLNIDGNTVIHVEEVSDQATGGTVDLTAGPHAVEVTYKKKDGPSALEWTWTPPGKETSIVPPSALAPPPGTTVGEPVPQSALGRGNDQPTDVPPDHVP